MLGTLLLTEAVHPVATSLRSAREVAGRVLQKPSRFSHLIMTRLKQFGELFQNLLQIF